MKKLTSTQFVSTLFAAIHLLTCASTATAQTTIEPTFTDEKTIVAPQPQPTNQPIQIVSCKDSIFNARNCTPNSSIVNLESAIRRQTGLTDKNQIRAAVYTHLIQIARSPNRTSEEKALMDWLVLQVKQTRIEAARLALAEYDRWARDPWKYQPPAGYDFPAYTLPDARSRVWLTTTPNPPVLANKSWQSFFAEIISNNAWSPLNNPMLSKGSKSSSSENIVGFPVFGTVLAYQKLYGTDNGVRAFAETAANLNSRSFNLPPVGATLGSPGSIQAFRLASLNQLAPYASRNLTAINKEFVARAAGTSRMTPIDPNNPKTSLADIVKSLSDKQLRSSMSRIVSGDALGGFVASFVLSGALQEIINESIMLDSKLKLRGQLVASLDKQQKAALPNLDNLLYWDIKGVVAVYTSDYQPTDATELERMMGSQEVYRAFLLATLD